MIFSTNLLLLTAACYLLLLFGIAYAADRRFLPAWIIDHPATYVLSLGVYAGSFAIYGAIAAAQSAGFSYIYYFVGFSGALMFMPILIQPLYNICKTYRLNSLADLVSFRFRSQWAGTLTTVFMGLLIWPLIAIQIQTVSDTVLILTNDGSSISDDDHPRRFAAWLFCVMLMVFTILFGSRNLAAKDSHRGLVTALAFESLIKLLAVVTVGVIAVATIFGGFEGMQQWLTQRPEVIEQLRQLTNDQEKHMLLVMAFSASMCLPHMFHMLIAENPSHRNLRAASWGLPLYLLLLSLPILPLLWAGQAVQVNIPADYTALGLAFHLDQPWLTGLIYLGGLSAASGIIIVATLSLASMNLNHVALPLFYPTSERVDIYRWLLWTRQILIVGIIAVSYGMYEFMPVRHSLSDLLIAALTGALQFLPGLLAVLYWPQANRKGFICGLIAGFTVWIVGTMLPLLGIHTEQLLPFSELSSSTPYWVMSGSLSLSANVIVFIMVSLLTETSQEERGAAEACTLDDLNRPSRHALNLRSAREMRSRLIEALGNTAAREEFQRALEELRLSDTETRPYALRRIRDRIEVNLSALVGPGNARRLIDRALPYSGSQLGEGEDITFIEDRLERYQTHLTGLAADLDGLRRYHRQTLENLPIGVCALGADQEILMWNKSIAAITGVDSVDITGSSVSGLPWPWAICLSSFLRSDDDHWTKYSMETAGGHRWLNLHKTESHTAGRNELLIVVEDITDTQLLEQELTHQERLASIGRLAAGVAHEIGNPVTGIACLAQNLRYDTSNPESLETADQIIKQTQRISSIVQSLVNFAHTGRDDPSQAFEAVTVRDCVDEAMHLLSLDSDAKQTCYDNRCPADIQVAGDYQRLMQVFINLISNAQDASKEVAHVTVDAGYSQDRLHSGQVHITLTDQGSGIDDKLREQIFEPFFTTKDPGQGTGLGLALVYNIISDLGGEISAESPIHDQGLPQQGTRFHILLPPASSLMQNSENLEKST